MECQLAQQLLHGYLDRELDLVRSVELEQHLESCPACQAAFEEQQAMRSAIGGSGLSYRAPTALRERIQSDLRRASPAQGAWDRRLRPLMGLAAAAVLLLAVAWGINRRWSVNRDDALVGQVVASHVRSLLVDHIADLSSSDRHEVKPWFNGKLDYAPEVVDFAAQGFPLLGGRLDYLDERPVAALVYGRRKHVINLFCWPASEERSATITELHRNGFQLVAFSKPGMHFWAVSDLNEAELQQFARLVQDTRAEIRPD